MSFSDSSQPIKISNIVMILGALFVFAGFSSLVKNDDKMICMLAGAGMIIGGAIARPKKKPAA